MKVRTTIKAGGLLGQNHNQSGLKVRSSVKAGFNPQPDPPGKR